ncbi:MAG: hypothetical protein MZW92_52585 [Comamonadaceae bacterium]|nr:hypothetical protein [Comamonadaceae bacterium]
MVDISGGGIASDGRRPAGFEFAIDQEFESCELDLPDAGADPSQAAGTQRVRGRAPERERG